MEEIVRYTYRLRPGRKAEAALMAQWDACRWVWNQCVARDAELWADGFRSTGYELKRELTDWRGRYEWLAAQPAVPQHNTVLAWATAQRAWLRSMRRGQGRPHFKAKRHALPSLNYTQTSFGLRDACLRLVGDVNIPIVWSRDLPCEPSSVQVYRDAVGHWWASFVVRRQGEALTATGKALGVDWGVKVTATASDPEFDLPHSQHGKVISEKLARAQRKMARRRKRGVAPSKGYNAARHEAARLYQMAVWQRKDAARKWAKKVVDAHDQIAVEDFKPKFLAKSTMARKALDAAIGDCKRELVERGKRAGREVVLVPPAFTTMDCSGCGARAKQRLGLSERVFTCHDCGLVEDRDRNAARTILARAGFTPASVESVRRDPASAASAA